jgi:hypothetical protein
MNLTNKHIVLILIIIIIFVFIYNFDVYVVPKNEPLCKPLYVTKRELTPEERANFNKTESVVFHETFTNLLENDYFEGFDMTTELIPPRTLSSYSVPFITDPDKIRVIDSVVKVLSYIPTTYSEEQIKELIEYFSMIYNSSDSKAEPGARYAAPPGDSKAEPGARYAAPPGDSTLENFYQNVAKSEKIMISPYNSKYAHLILFLIGKFDSDIHSKNFSGIPGDNNNNNNSFDIQPEDIPVIIHNYNIQKDLKENEKENENNERDEKPGHKKKSKKPKRKNNSGENVIYTENESFNMVDRDTVATRVNSTHTAPYSANFSGINNYSGNEYFSNYNSGNSGNSSNSDYLTTSLQDSFSNRATDYMNQHIESRDNLNYSSHSANSINPPNSMGNSMDISPLESFNSMGSGFASVY